MIPLADASFDSELLGELERYWKKFTNNLEAVYSARQRLAATQAFELGG